MPDTEPGSDSNRQSTAATVTATTAATAAQQQQLRIYDEMTMVAVSWHMPSTTASTSASISNSIRDIILYI